jgi:hypothetical protein
MRRALALTVAAAALSGCDILTSDFRLSGSVEVAPSLRGRVAKEGEMLFVVAENEGGVPVAVHRIVNPEFPSDFKMGPEDLLVPAVRGREPLQVHAELNVRGKAGEPQEGDLEGNAAATCLPGARGVKIVLEKVK